jgi:hypothetical protein
LERPELVVIEQQLKSRELDLLICEDLGRVVRGAEAVRLCGIAVDHGTRVLAPNDCFDTDDPDWETDILSICRDHVGHNVHTSKRIKKKKMNRFQREIAKQVSEPTLQVVVQQALALDRMMKERGLTSPYEILLEPPQDYGNLRRHKYPRYQFRPLEGYERPQI